MNALKGRPPILYGAIALAALSLLWSGYAIADLMQSGKFGLSVAIAGDIGWVTVLWAEYKGVTIAGRRWTATAAGWAIAFGVAALLVIHGQQAGGLAQAIAGPFVVVVGKTVWAFAIEAMKDAAAPTPEMVAELDTVMRNASHQSALLDAQTRVVVDRIKAEAERTMQRDEADFQIALRRMEKRSEIERRTPMVIEPSRVETGADRAAGEGASIGEQMAQLIAIMGDQARDRVRDQSANTQASAPIPDRDQGPSIADLAREQIAITSDNKAAINAILAVRPDADRASVGAAVRRARKAAEGPYL